MLGLKLKWQFVSILSAVMLMLVVGTAQAQEPGNALDFDGTDYVEIADNNTLDLSGSITLEAWIFNNAFSGRVIDKINAGGTNGYMLDTFPNNVRLIIGDGTIATCALMGSTPLNTLQWYHIAGVFDSSDTVAGCKVYVNGVLDASVAPSNTNAANANTFPLRLGQQNPGPGNFFNGRMDNVRIWNRALSPAELLSRFNCTSSLPTANLVASFNFNQGVAGGANAGVTTLFDQSGNNNNMTLTNFNLSGATSNWVASGAPITGACPVPAVGGVAEVIAMPTTSTSGLGYLAGMAGVVMLIGAGWLLKRRG